MVNKFSHRVLLVVFLATLCLFLLSTSIKKYILSPLSQFFPITAMTCREKMQPGLWPLQVSWIVFFSYLHNNLWKKVLVKENIFKKSVALTHLHYFILHQKSISCLQSFRVEMLLIFSILCTNIPTHIIIPEKLNICWLPDNPILYWKKIKHLGQNIAQWNYIHTSEYYNPIASISKLLVHLCKKQEDNDILRNSPLLFSWTCHLLNSLP